MSLLSNTKDDFKNLSGLPWEYLFADGAHYVVSGCTQRPIAVFSEERNARLVVEIFSNLPELLEDFEDTYTDEEYQEVVDNNTDLEKELEAERQQLRESAERLERLRNTVMGAVSDLGEASDGAE